MGAPPHWPTSPDDDPQEAQRGASDPAASVWVAASAGTGKTKVLTDRVLRLMLDGTEPRLETHLFDVSPELYGRKLAVELHHFLRPEKKFDGIEALRAQIAEDCVQARRLLAADGEALRVRASGG